MQNNSNIKNIKELSKKIRKNILDMSLEAGASSSHFGGSLSTVEILSTLYQSVMKFDYKKPLWNERDRFILSKGHACLGFYSVLHQFNFLKKEDLKTFEKNDSFLLGHPVINKLKGIEFSNGSLGMGLSIGIGIALAKNHLKLENKVYVILGDGECNEGSIWEGAMAASKFKLQNLRVIIDKNNYQQTGSTEEVMPNKNLGNKFDQFGWNVNEVDGHNLKDLYAAIIEDKLNEKPSVIVANTIKGKGVQFFENDNKWHHNLLTKVDYENAIKEVLN